YLMRAGYEVFGVDRDRRAIESVRHLAAALAPQLPADNFRVERIEQLTLPDGFAHVVLSSAVLHFAGDDLEFMAMLRGTWRILAPGGLLVCRLASSIGMESRVRPLGGRRFVSPDGVERYLVDQAFLMSLTRDLGGELLDPLKTTIVQDERCMTTWVV